MPAGGGRSIFALPWLGHALVGTTDNDYEGPLDHVVPSVSDIEYLLEAVNGFFGTEFGPGELSGAFAGVRPLISTGDPKKSVDISRKAELYETSSGLITITGGKLTTWRRMAKMAVDRLVEREARDAPCRTHEIPLGQAVPADQLPRVEGVAEEAYAALAGRYGYAAREVLELAATRGELAQPILPGLPDLLAEVALAARREQARSIGDVLFRRTRLALLAGRDAGARARTAARRRPPGAPGDVLARELGWDQQRLGLELERFEQEARAEGVVPSCWRPGRVRRARADEHRPRALSAPRRTLSACELEIELGDRPWLMGVVNASPDSFSDGGRVRRPRRPPGARPAAAGRRRRHHRHRRRVGHHREPRRWPWQQELELVVPLVEAVAGGLGALVSVDTYKPQVAAAAIAAGARIVNDVSGLRDPALAEVCARSGAALVVMHTRAAPRQRLQDPELYDDLMGEVLEFLRERMRLALERGCRPQQLIVDPGPDFAKTPAQTVRAAARAADRLHELGRPLLLAISRKDFIGALTGRSPRERLAGTLAALEHGVECGAHIVRLHDVREAADFLRVRAALAGELPVDPQLALQDQLRHER